jgi:glycosyltransferase involved in cell wall biosynthesis
VRVIARLNIGGPAIQAITLTQCLEPFGYDTTLLRGREDPDEGNMDYLAQELGVQPVLIPSLRRDPGRDDLRALAELVRHLRRARPHIVHTHAAKAGTLGRLAAVLAFRPARRPVLVHTFHGHSLSGYFSARRNAVFASIERFLARRTDRLIAVSEQVRDELVALGVAGHEKFEIVRLGLDLSRFRVPDQARAERRAAFRADVGIPSDARLVTLVARLVPIKRVDRFLRVANLLASEPNISFLIVGDGELRDHLRNSTEASSLGNRLFWAGFRRDMPDVYFASDVVVQTSDNEGTPVALIEAMAAGLPVVSTAVGGVRSAVLDGETGRVTRIGDDTAMAEAVLGYVRDGELSRRHGSTGRGHAQATFTLQELTERIDALYRALLYESRTGS